MNQREVEISKRALGQIRGGSLWIFANEFQTKMKDLNVGEWVNFHCKGEFVGFGYVNPHSLIAGRVCSLKPVSDRKTFLKTAIEVSLKKRANLENIVSYRGVFAESDSLPGLIIDVYGKNVVIQLNTAGLDQAQDEIVTAVEELLNPAGLVVRADSSVRSLEGVKNHVDVIKGEEQALRESFVAEDGVKFAADFIDGQKTGFFLDQRESRIHVKNHAQDKTILDLFCYSGGWGLSALKGGAQSCLFVDQSNKALELVKRGLEANRFAGGETLEQDAFDFLAQHKGKYDIVICDPPAFVKSKKNIGQALKAYKKLNGLALERLKEGGVLYTCSCSFHLQEHEFETLLMEALKEQNLLGEVVYRGGQPSDHPWILNRPESRYLKCLGLQVKRISDL